LAGRGLRNTKFSGKLQGADAKLPRCPVAEHAAGLNRIRVPSATCNDAVV
jgi:hypothetical protein